MTKPAVDSRWVTFEDIEDPKRKTRLIQVQSKDGVPLGYIKWFSHWRQYCFWPAENTVYNAECMDDITRKVREAMRERG